MSNNLTNRNKCLSKWASPRGETLKKVKDWCERFVEAIETKLETKIARAKANNIIIVVKDNKAYIASSEKKAKDMAKYGALASGLKSRLRKFKTKNDKLFAIKDFKLNNEQIAWILEDE